jgi:carbamoyltransferase
MEFGPRALGGRSILADPRSPDTQRVLNMKIKYRESFRPFAPSVLRERAAEWFELTDESPYMLLVADVASSRRSLDAAAGTWSGVDRLRTIRSDIPAVTHVDYSARIQTVDPETNPLYHELLRVFADLTGCPVLVNTSFNVRGEPIVCSPLDAFKCFMGTDLDRLVIGRCVLIKTRQDPALRHRYAEDVQPD